MKLKLATLTSAFLLGGCASPWVSYQEAVRCHLDERGPACNPLYKKAISENSKMPGVHSSYGTHLLLQGNSDEATHEFKVEQENYPQESSKAITALLNPTQAAANASGTAPIPVATEPTATPAAPPTSTPVNSAPPASTNAPKATSAKKDSNRAK